MAFDGIVVKSVVEELRERLKGGRIDKIFQPEKDEIILQVRSIGQNFKLILSANASYPRIHLTDLTKDNPLNPPVFCMVLRKHLSGGKILDIGFHDFERIVDLEVESINELGDVSTKKLIIEIMGRHSNIILVNNENRIIDAIKHVDNEISSVREVMPARPYMLPPSQDKISPADINIQSLLENAAKTGNISIEKFLLNNIKGFSPLLCREICYLANIDGKKPLEFLSDQSVNRLENVLQDIVNRINASDFEPCIAFEDENYENPVDFHCFRLRQYKYVKTLPSISTVLNEFYAIKDAYERLKQKKADLVKVIHTNIDRCQKKISLQQEKLREVADREKLKLYGELITANIYSIPKNAKSVSLLNYYSEEGEYIDIPLDDNLSPQENAQRYYKQYSKAKNAYASTSIQLEESLKELEYLESVSQLLDDCTTVQEINEIRQELAEQGYISLKKGPASKKQDNPSKPLCCKSSDGYYIYIGKNNKQNDMLTLKTAQANDIWLHTKNIPGSHVIIRKHTREDVPSTTLLEAAMLAAYHSKAKMSSNVPVDYTTVRNVKKPNGAKPGMVIYENYKTIIVTPEKDTINKLLNKQLI
ncbi:MAG TPA: fibronectin/fibrinogen-binding protein [Clostridiaceae bacterium]|nr:fibronectin/fibrinogen-binding protein [Clostridiaceae bacterium]